MTTDPDTYRLGLQAAAERRTRARDEERAALKDLAQLCAEAQEAGLSVSEIARLGGVSRMTVYQFLKFG